MANSPASHPASGISLLTSHFLLLTSHSSLLTPHSTYFSTTIRYFDGSQNSSGATMLIVPRTASG